MNANFTIKNPHANNVFGMYVDEPIGMDHPLFMIRFQSGIDARFLYQGGVPIQDAIQQTVKRMRFLFGDNIPEELVRTAVSLVYAENDALHPMQSDGELPISANEDHLTLNTIPDAPEGKNELDRITQLPDEDIQNSRFSSVKIEPLILIPALMKLVVEGVRMLWRCVKSGAYYAAMTSLLVWFLWFAWVSSHYWLPFGLLIAGLLIFEVLVKNKTNAMGRFMVLVGGMGFSGGVVGASEQLSPIERRLETIDKQTWKPLRSIWSHPTLGLVELLKTYPGASNARVMALASTELDGGGFHAKGNIYYVPRDQIKFAYSIPRDNYQLPS